MRSLRSNKLFSSLAIVFAATFILLCVTPSKAAAQSTPEATLIAFYKWYLHEFSLEHNPRPTSPKVNAIISTRLRSWFKSKEGREWDADYFIDAQDWDPKWETHIETTKAVINGNKADVHVILGPRVKAVNSMSPHTLRVKMVKEKGGWKIDHINGY
jgi:hypothetical protein